MRAAADPPAGVRRHGTTRAVRVRAAPARDRAIAAVPRNVCRSAGRGGSTRRTRAEAVGVRLQPLSDRRQRLGVGRFRHRVLVLGPRLEDVERRREVEDRLAVLDRHDPSRREAAAIADAIDVVDDRHSDHPIAGSTRMRVQSVFDRTAGRDQRLTGDLSSETRAGGSRRGSSHGTGSPRAARARAEASRAVPMLGDPRVQVDRSVRPHGRKRPPPGRSTCGQPKKTAAVS